MLRGEGKSQLFLLEASACPVLGPLLAAQSFLVTVLRGLSPSDNSVQSQPPFVSTWLGETGAQPPVSLVGSDRGGRLGGHIQGMFLPQVF